MFRTAYSISENEENLKDSQVILKKGKYSI